MKTILILLDTLNRHMLSTYGKPFAKTPNIERLAARSITMDNHWLGSAPCMPARRDIMTGRLNFLERPWGPIEPFDVTLPELLRKAGVFTHITTDHSHYFETGGENYCQAFNSWDFHRGQEFDPWVSRVGGATLPENMLGRASEQYELNRTRFTSDADYSTPQTLASGCRWLQDNRGADNFFLMIEGFDPHEPFDCTAEYLDMYNDTYDGPRFDWPKYQTVEESPEAIEHVRNRYAATLTMADHWLGKLLDEFDQQDLWEDTLIIFTTDHGHMLGEHGFTGKNFMHAYNEMAHLPCLVHLPNDVGAGTRCEAITQNIDLFPTILDFHNVELPSAIHGHSMLPLLRGEVDEVRAACLFGWFGSAVNVYDGRYTYFRAAQARNQPLHLYGAIPTTLWRFIGREHPEHISMGRFLKYTDYPVYKIPMPIPRRDEVSQSQIFDLTVDYEQLRPVEDKALEQRLIEVLQSAMQEHDSPDEQYERLGIS